MRSILDYIKVFKNIEMYKDPKLRYASIPDASDPDLEQSEPLRPGETLETWKPNPFLKPHAEGGRAGYNDGNTVLPEPNPLSQEERNQKVFYDYVERFKEYLKGSKMPEWFVKDLIKEKAKELGIELADGGRADGGRIGYYKGKLVTRGPNTGKYKIKFPTNTILSDEYKGTKYGTEIEIENLIKKRDKLAQKNIKLKVGPKKSAELRIQKRDANFKSLVDDIVKSGDLTALKSNIRQRGGKIPNEWVVDFWNPAIKGGKDSKAMKKLSEILGRDPTEILSLHEGRVGKIKEVQKIVDTEKALAAVDPNKKKFLEILNTSDKLDLKTVAKQLKLSQINTNNLINSVYKDIYKNTSLLGKEETNFVRYLPDKKTPLSALLRSMNKIEGVDKIARRTITDLLDKTIGFKAAKKYQNPELYKLFKSRIHEFYKLKDALPEGLILNLDHPLSMKVINQLGTDVRLQKINVSPITQELNMGLKAQFDKVYGKAIKNNNIKAQRAIEKIAHQIELPMTKVGKEVTDPTKFKFIAEDLKSQILSSLENQNKIAKNIKNIDPNLLKAAGMEKYKFNVPEVTDKQIQEIEKILGQRGIKLKKGQAGFIATDILKDAKKLGPKGLRLLASDWVWPEIVIGWLDKKNNIQKGMSEERASSEMWKNMTFGLWDKGGTENAISEQAKKLGYGEKDIKALEHIMRYGKLSKEIKDTEVGIEGMEKGYTPFSSEKGAQQLKEKLENLKKERESVAGFYFGAIGDKDSNYGFEIYNQASKELMRTEWNKSLEGRKKRIDPYAGGVGDVFQADLFSLEALKPKHWLGLEKSPSTLAREKIAAMSPQELDKWNLQERGIGYERVHPMYGAAMSGKQMEPLRDQIGYMYAGGGMVGIRKPNAIAPTGGPQSQGLASTPEYDTYSKEYKWQI